VALISDYGTAVFSWCQHGTIKDHPCSEELTM